MAWLSSWAKRREITVSNTNIDSNLTHFPLNLFLGASVGTGTTDITSIFDEVGANDKKIAVTDSSGDTQIYVEIEDWDDTGETAELWVSKSDLTLSSSGNTTLYIYYDNAQADNTTFVADTGSRTEVYDSDFKAVYHMNETSGTRTDSTSNNNDASDNNTVTTETGQIAGAASFDPANSEYLNASDSASLSITGDITVDFWMNYNSLPGTFGNDYPILQKALSAGDQRSYIVQFEDGSDKMSFTYYEDGTSSPNRFTEMDEVFVVGDVDTWIHIMIAVDVSAGTLSFYRDGVSKSNTPSGTAVSIFDGSADLDIGGNTTTKFMNGGLDDVRVMSGLRSAAFAKATYNSGTDNLLSYGSEELMPASTFTSTIIMID